MKNINEETIQYTESVVQFEDAEIEAEKCRDAWLKRLAEEYLKLEPAMPMANFLPDEGCPAWVENVEREAGATLFPVAKLKAGTNLTPRRLGAIIGHQCVMGVWMMEWLEKELKKPQGVDDTKPTPEQIEAGKAFLRRLTEEWHPALCRLAKRALCSCVDQSYEDMLDFLQGYSTAFAQKPAGHGWGSFGSSTFEIYHFLLFHWRMVERLESVRHLHEVFVKVFGPYRTGELKRTEKICQRIGLSFRKPGRPPKKTIQTPAP